MQLVPPKPRPRDLLKLTDFPIHPFDHTHGTDTSGLVPAKHLRTGSPSDEHVTAYYGVAPSILRGLVARWLDTAPTADLREWTFVDIGAGKGRALLVASELGFRQVIGVELNARLVEIALSNTTTWAASHAADPTATRVAPIEVLHADALEFDLPAGPVLLFLFHPFEGPLLEQMLDRMQAQLSRRRSPALDVLYVNAECREAFESSGRFRQLFLGSVPMTPEDHAADLEAIAQQKEYGSTGDEECAIYRWTGSITLP